MREKRALGFARGSRRVKKRCAIIPTGLGVSEGAGLRLKRFGETSPTPVIEG